MRGMLVCGLLLALGAAALADKPCVCNYGHGGHGGKQCSALQSRVDSQEARISRLSGKLQELKDRYKEGGEKREKVQKQQANLHFRLHALEDEGCEKGEFSCGDEHRCITDLAVCDGSNDCHNGRDEDPQRCVNPVESGSVFFAEIHGHNFCTTRHLNSIKITITHVKQLTWFKSTIHLGASVELDFTDDDAHQVDTLHVEGYYNYSHRRVVFHPPEDDRLGLTCEFDGADNDHCHGHVVREATLEKCMDYYAVRQH